MINAINRAVTVVITNTVQLILVRYAKSCNHLFITHHATGDAIRMAMPTSFKKSFDSSATIPATLAPNTLRTPISLVRCSALNVARPNKPRQEMRMAIMVKYPTMAANDFPLHNSFENPHRENCIQKVHWI